MLAGCRIVPASLETTLSVRLFQAAPTKPFNIKVKIQLFVCLMTTAPLYRWLSQESPLVGLCFLPWKNDGLSTFVFLSDREDSWNSIRGEAVQAACCLLRLIALIICLTQRWIYSSFQLPTKTLLHVYICVCCVKRGLEPASKRQRRKVILTSGLYFISTNWTRLPPNIFQL